jgi:hypothetical protein
MNGTLEKGTWNMTMQFQIGLAGGRDGPLKDGH